MSTIREQRQALIAKYVRSKEVTDQKTLRELLLLNGIPATQSTISRDLSEMGVTKFRSGKERSFYRMPERTARTPEDVVRIRPTHWFKELVYSEPFIVVKTRPGYANSLAADIDSLEHPSILATVSGYDSILVISANGATLDDVKEALGMVIPELKE